MCHPPPLITKTPLDAQFEVAKRQVEKNEEGTVETHFSECATGQKWRQKVQRDQHGQSEEETATSQAKYGFESKHIFMHAQLPDRFHIRSLLFLAILEFSILHTYTYTHTYT